MRRVGVLVVGTLTYGHHLAKPALGRVEWTIHPMVSRADGIIVYRNVEGRSGEHCSRKGLGSRAELKRLRAFHYAICAVVMSALKYALVSTTRETMQHKMPVLRISTRSNIQRDSPFHWVRACVACHPAFCAAQDDMSVPNYLQIH